MGQLQGRVALVTGAAMGIGAACATALAEAGARLVLTDLDARRGEAAAAAIRAAGGEAIFLPQDVTEEPRWLEVVAETERAFGRLDVLVANAGIAVLSPVWEMSLADWRRQVAVNLDGVFLATKHAIPALRRAGGGSIIMLSSIAGLRGSAGLAGYSATKGAVRLFAKSVALELAREGIRVNSVHPGIIETAIWEKMPAEASTPRRNAPIDPQGLVAGIPQGVLGQPADIAAGVVFLASDAARHITGSELVIDGGITAGRAGMLGQA